MFMQDRSPRVVRAAVVTIAVIAVATSNGAGATGLGDLVWPAAVDQTDRRHVTVAQRDLDLDVEVVLAPRDVRLSQHGGFWAASFKDGQLADETPGHPWLPSQVIPVLVPGGAQVEAIEVEAEEVLLAGDILLQPAQPSVPVSARLPAIPAFVPPDAAAYAATTKVPAAVAQMVGQYRMRNHSIAWIRVNPLRYVPAARELYLATRITMRLRCSGGQRKAFAHGRVGREVFDNAVTRMVANPEMLGQIATTQMAPTAAQQPAGLTDYLIITSSQLADTFQLLADHRAAHNAFATAVVTTETIATTYPGADTQAKIRACIEDYVHNRGTVYVVLGGDNTIVPDRNCSVMTETAMPTDLYYAGLDSTWDEDGDGIYGESGEGDLAPDVYVGRIPVRTPVHATNYINKVIAFDNNPIPNDRMILMGVHLGANSGYQPYTGTNRPTDVMYDGHSDFASHSPVSDTEMWVRRMYRDTIQPHWQPTTLGLLFDTLTSWDTAAAGDYWMVNANVRARLDEGWFHVFMLTHATANLWQVETTSFTTTDAGRLTARLGIIYTGSCDTGAFDDESDPCLSEAFLRDAEGPVAYFGCSRSNWYEPDQPPASNVSRGGTAMEYARAFYDQFFRTDHTSLAQVFYAHKAVRAGWAGGNGTDRWVQFGLNYQGDPALLAPARRTLTVNVQGQGTVALDPPGGIYDPGSSVQMTAVPAEGTWRFVRWEGDVTGTANPTTVVMDRSISVSAVFAMPGDVTGDGHVDVEDLLWLVDAFGSLYEDANYNAACDFDGDGAVDVVDLLILIENFGT